MATTNIPVLSSNTGVVSPLIDARSDLKKFSSSCRTLRNMIPRIYGCSERRPGTKYIASTKDSSQVSRMVDFQYSDTIAYEMEVGPEYIRFYYDGAQLVGSTTTPTAWADATAYIVGQFVTHTAVVYRCLVAHTSDDDGDHDDPASNFTDWVVADLDSDDYPICETPTPYQESDLFELQFHQSADVVWITHNEYPPRKLTRTTAYTFDLSVINFINGPFLKRNDLAKDDDVTITPSDTWKSFLDYASSDNTGVAAESLASGTASGTVAATNDGNVLTYRKRRGHNNALERLNSYSAWSYFTMTFTFIETVTRLDEIKYWIGWYNNGSSTRTVAVSVQQGGAWTSVGTSTNNKSNIIGPWTDVTAVKIYLYTKTTWVNSDAYADCILYELEAWGTTNVDLTYKEITLVSSSAVFDPSHATSPGALFQLTQPRLVFKTGDDAVATGVMSAPIDVKGSFSWNVHGEWTGTIELQRNESSEGWETYRTFVTANDLHLNDTYTEESDNVQYRLNVTTWTSGTCHAEITVNESTQSGICRVIGYTSSTQVTAEIITDFASTEATKRWNEGAWSAYRGYPAAFTFFEERAVYGGTTYRPQTIWFSGSRDFDDFEEGTKDGDSFWRTLSSDKRNGIRWMSSIEALIVGTRGGEWRIRATANDEEITPTNFNARPQTARGSAKIQPVQVGDTILFVDSPGRKLRELTFSDYKQKFVTPDLTALAEHITLTGITCMAHQKNPDDIVWFVLDDGKLISMSYEREQDVIAWAQHIIGGTDVVVESVSVIPGTDEDEVWLTVSRTINGSTARTVEQLQPRVDVDLEDAWFVDCGGTWDGGAAVTITNITAADPPVVTAVGHGFNDGEQVYIAGVVGMTEVNGNVYTVNVLTVDTFELLTFREVSPSA